jgi:hypothetical protein
VVVLATSACQTRPGVGSVLRIEVVPEDRDADVYVDGNYVGQVEGLDDPELGHVRLAPGVHRVEVRKPGRFPVQRTVRIADDPPRETSVAAELLENPQ